MKENRTVPLNHYDYFFKIMSFLHLTDPVPEFLKSSAGVKKTKRLYVRTVRTSAISGMFRFARIHYYKKCFLIDSLKGENRDSDRLKRKLLATADDNFRGARFLRALPLFIFP
ncbi:MAG: hypothetical protein KJ739_01775 [Nitrospinae bacterium]|nr:hypothetical protein [Nitrospinota bacterium]